MCYIFGMRGKFYELQNICGYHKNEYLIKTIDTSMLFKNKKASF